MSKINLRSPLHSSKDKESLDNRFSRLLDKKKSVKSSYSTSMNQSSSNSSANISFLKDMNFPKLFQQTPMLFSFNPQSTKNSVTMTRSTSSSAFNSGARTPNSSSSYSSFKGFFKNKDQLKSMNMFNKKKKDITIDLSKKSENQSQSKKHKNLRQNHKYNSSNLTSKNSQARNNLLINPNDLIPKEQNIKVFIRIKPIKDIPQVQKACQQSYINRIDGKHLQIESKIMAYDHIFAQNASQQEVFKAIALPIVDNVIEGYNGTIFAYGQTGSGKTHTMFGQLHGNENQGIIPRIIGSLFQRKEQSNKIELSMLEIYKQQLIDLLTTRKDLRIKQSSSGVQIENLSRSQANSSKQALLIIENSQKNRKVAATKLNDKSSRSHTILTIYLSNSEFETKLCLIDLAGSQKVSKAGVTGENLQQTKKINYSLSCLGNVINALVTRKKSDHIPFRDSKLTRILQDSLCGKFKTSIIVNCSADQGTNQQTLSSLKFADRAKKIKVTISKHNLKGKENVEYLHLVIKKLTTDLEETKKELCKYKQICNQGKNNEESTGSIQVEEDHKVQNQKNQQQFQNACLQKQIEVQADITPRPIPSQRANADQIMKKYGKQNDFLRNRIRIPLNNKIFGQHNSQKGASRQNSKSGKQGLCLINTNNQLSSLNVSRSVVNFFGEINSPSISSLSVRNQENSEDFSLNLSLQKQDSNRESFKFI